MPSVLSADLPDALAFGTRGGPDWSHPGTRCRTPPYDAVRPWHFPLPTRVFRSLVRTYRAEARTPRTPRVTGRPGRAGRWGDARWRRTNC
ncbi:hypothetical protein GCM10017779_26870 [Streptomyces capillispiralis]|nr:hypothetical protein GCM10017779_26870 [Streptomyces capillispiralis]